MGMRAEEKSALQSAHVELMKMNPTALKELLYAKKLLTMEEYEMLENKPTTGSKNSFIAMLLPKKDASAFGKFVACLRETSDENEVHKELADKLESCICVHDE